MTTIDATIEAIITEIRTRMPSLDEMAMRPDDGTLGPDVTIPAVWMHILLTHIRHRSAQCRGLELEKIGSLPLREPPMSEDEVGEYAGALATHAVRARGDNLAGASVLIQGAVAILMTSLPAEAVIKTLENVVDLFDLRSTLGVEAAAQ